ncbi:3-deoxy-7-phosphoheptulonate synthase [Millisia brevis]|uniref:3-deoxy-7-phosphoheptulonate synthase n=1 Tax=Millisia brevis TaxID=264148 RepID=UPI000836E48E|nr:3-deoxy-7-phosphoheptulonate synthase [Millisia brevis]
MTTVVTPAITAPAAAVEPLSPAAVIVGELPASDSARSVVDAGRAVITDILAGRDDRILAIVGPCSVHDPEAVVEYAGRLAELGERMSDAVVPVLRAYFEKPRTTVGWKGLIDDPDLDGSHHMERGLRTARRVLLDAADLGLPSATEFLDPMVSGYLADLVAYGAIGARTAASQTHRQLASGLPMPVGIKNAMDGDVQIAVDGVASARTAHRYPGVDADGRAAIISTVGNPMAHVILRGGASGPNYDERSVLDAAARLDTAGLNPRLVVDASHGNSAKQHRRQSLVLGDVAGRVAAGDRVIAGVMVESFLVEGRQDVGPAGRAGLVRGQSITDACLGWEDTAAALEVLAGAVRTRRLD